MIFGYVVETSWCISLSKNQALVCIITLSKTTTGIYIVQWKLIIMTSQLSHVDKHSSLRNTT